MNNQIDTKEIEIYKKDLAKAEKYSTSLQVTSDESYKEAMNEAKQIKEIVDKVTTRKEEITKPMNAALKSVRELFKPLETMGEEAISQIKRKMLSYTSEKQRIADEAKAKLDARVEKGTMKEETAERKKEEIKAPETTIKTDEAKTVTKMIRKVRFNNLKNAPAKDLQFLAENEYIVWNEVKARKDALAGVLKSGVEIYEEPELSLF